MDTEHQKLTYYSSSNLHLARRVFRPQRTLRNDTHRNHDLLSKSVDSADNSLFHFSSGDNAATRSCKLNKPSGPNSKTNLTQNEKDNKVSQKNGFGHSGHSEQQLETQYMQMDQGFLNSIKTRFPMPQYRHPNRCISEQLGIPNRQQTLLRQLRQVNALLNNYRYIDLVPFLPAFNPRHL